MAENQTNPQADPVVTELVAPENTNVTEGEVNTSVDPAPAAPAPADATPVPSAEDVATQQQAAADKMAADKMAAAEAMMKKAEDVLARAEARAVRAEAAAGKDPAAELEAANEEKAAVVSRQLQLAHPDEDLGEEVPFTPAVTMSNNTKVGMIVFEKGVTYTLPKGIAEDLQARQQVYLDYQEKLHIREEVSIKAGTLSGGGK